RPDEMELSLLAADLAQVEAVAELDLPARRLAAAFWPGPLSLIVPARRPRRLAVPRRGDSLSVRVPAHALLGELLAEIGPLASTSANRHGGPPCGDARCVRRELGDELDAVLDGGAAAGRGSTIIDLTQHPPRVLRVGPLSAEQLHPYLEG
ncbi:MAG: L-threonylcarbamoyladenylate synthase, partial [Chloroflexi bacterium]